MLLILQNVRLLSDGEKFVVLAAAIATVSVVYWLAGRRQKHGK